MLDLNQMILVLKLKKLFLIEINKLQKVKQNHYLNQKILTISSDGFNIYDKGNKIIFYGNSYIILK